MHFNFRFSKENPHHKKKEESRHDESKPRMLSHTDQRGGDKSKSLGYFPKIDVFFFIEKKMEQFSFVLLSSEVKKKGYISPLIPLQCLMSDCVRQGDHAGLVLGVECHDIRSKLPANS